MPSGYPRKGSFYSYCIVHRSFPGIEVPYVSAIVDLEGGGTIKGNLINIERTQKKLNLICPLKSFSKMHW